MISLLEMTVTEEEYHAVATFFALADLSAFVEADPDRARQILQIRLRFLPFFDSELFKQIFDNVSLWIMSDSFSWRVVADEISDRLQLIRLRNCLKSEFDCWNEQLRPNNTQMINNNG
jgi:hypothetical protein